MKVSAATLQAEYTPPYEPRVGDLVSFRDTIGVIIRVRDVTVEVMVLIGTSLYPYARLINPTIDVIKPWYGHLTLASRRDAE